ncbi:hypothetical protein GUJ93_ZPchr0013g34890 [Zizania palustris]|uniref:TSL-kinase interacting protein 1 n=1 Tax=Zizania palustris TaxID=103762 RepID=A0A8J6C1U8_ZIZPA|nr:hypothetical protein GUJ93_ZPchr0013g34890 [Zizania palustris]
MRARSEGALTAVGFPGTARSGYGGGRRRGLSVGDHPPLGGGKLRRGEARREAYLGGVFKWARGVGGAEFKFRPRKKIPPRRLLRLAAELLEHSGGLPPRGHSGSRLLLPRCSARIQDPRSRGARISPLPARASPSAASRVWSSGERPKFLWGEGRSILHWIAIVAENQKGMKPPQQRCKPTDTAVKEKLSCSKMQSLKPGKYINKSSGNANINAEELVLHQENRNPYLELTLAPRKKISSVVHHLNTKWGNSQCARGELTLFPYDARLDNIASSGKWTHSDSCTAADVHAAVGSPSTFRLRYGWFGPIFEQQSSGPVLEPVHTVDKIIGNEPLDPVFTEQKQMVPSSEFLSNFTAPYVGDTAVNIVDNQSKVTPLSWIDSISNISFGALLSEAAPSQDSKQLFSQNNTSFSQIPVDCDSFDAAIASMMARQQASNQPKVSNPSLWDAEETCHAFPLHNQTSIRTFGSAPRSSGAITSSILDTIPESVTDVDQQCFTEVTKEEASPHTSPSCTNNAMPAVSVPESIDEPELAESCSKLLSGTDSLELSGLLANSLDAFQKFSVF